MSEYFTLIWITIIAVGIFLYVVLDGFDLGVGILSRNAPSSAERETMIASISPFWDGNETWLILGAVGLLAAFPMAFAIIVPALYFPVLMMLVGLMFRGVAFEYRTVPSGLSHLWDHGFFAGSVLAAFSQGVMLGMFVEGFTVTGRTFSGSSFDWVAPFPLISGIALVFGYALLGAGWLVLKTEGALQDWARRMGRTMLIFVLGFIVIVSLYMLIHQPQVIGRWVGFPNIFLLWPVPLGTALAAFWAWRSFGNTHDAQPFIATVVMFGISFLGLAISLWPMIVPASVDLWTAAASPNSQAFLLVGTVVLLPVVLAYTTWSVLGVPGEGAGRYGVRALGANARIGLVLRTHKNCGRNRLGDRERSASILRCSITSSQHPTFSLRPRSGDLASGEPMDEEEPLPKPVAERRQRRGQPRPRACRRRGQEATGHADQAGNPLLDRCLAGGREAQASRLSTAGPARRGGAGCPPGRDP